MTFVGATYLDLIERGAAQNAARVALVFGDEQLTFQQSNERANQFAHALHAVGATAGSRIALLVNNGLDSVPLDFGCVKAGVNRVPLNSRLSVVEHLRMIEEAQCRTLIFGRDT